MDDEVISVEMLQDKEGFIGRECPNAECLGYFKVVPGTGMDTHDCFCPYCGQRASDDQFFTQEQIQYATSVALNRLTGEAIKAFKEGFEGAGVKGGLFSLRFEVTGTPRPIHYYRERQLEQRLTCEVCRLTYAIYGVFGYCPTSSWRAFNGQGSD